MENRIEPDFTEVMRSVASSETPKQMISIERDGTQTLVRINSSSLSLIQTCPRKSFYLLHQGWRSKSTSPALVFGLAIHKALEVFYAWPKAVREIPTNFAEHAALMAHGHPAPEHHFLYDAIKAFVTAGQPLKALPDTDKRSLTSGIWTLCHYFETYLTDPYTTYCDKVGSVTERTCEATLFEHPRLRIELFGTIDVVLRNGATGEVLPGDHKTASRMGADFLNRIKPNHQYTGYVYLAQKALDIQSENFCVNGIEVKARPLTARGKPPTFTRQITRRSEADIEEFKFAVVEAVENYLRWSKFSTEVGWPLGHIDSCAQWGGCTFLDVCSAPHELRENILDAKFERGKV